MIELKINAAPAIPAPEVSALRKDPYRLFFPLGVLLSWVGVGQWLSFSLGLSPVFRPIFHAMVQVQGFLACFVAGFLFTFIPRRTQSGPPAAWQLAVAAICPLLLALFAAEERWAVSQAFWLLQLGLLLQFAISRAWKMKNVAALPPSLVWIPLGLLCGIGGAVITGYPPFHDLGRALVLEGMVAALVMGIGAMLVPVVTRAEPALPATGGAAHLTQVALAFAFAASFVLQATTSLSPRFGYGLRLVVAVIVLVGGARLWRWPTQPGLNRRVAWLATWCLPLGYAVLTLWPEQRSVGLHVIFLGGFGLLAMAIGQHVVAAHGGRTDWLQAWPKATWALLGLTAVALAARIAMQLDTPRYLTWMTVAAVSFLAAGAAWMVGMVPMLRPDGRGH